MGILNKIFTAVRGGATEAGQAVVDSQAIRILEQEMRDSRKQLDNAKTNLTKVIAEEMAVERTVKKLKDSIEEHNAYAIQAMEKNNETLALEVATKIAELTNELESQESLHANYSENVSRLKQTIKKTEANISAMAREVNIVKTTESVHKASQAVASKFSGADSSMINASESLKRIKDRQQKREDQIAAANELYGESQGSDLQSKLKAAGIVGADASASAILDKLKAQQNK